MSGRESFIPFFSSVRTRSNQSRANEMPPTVVPVPHGGAAIVFEPDRYARSIPLLLLGQLRRLELSGCRRLGGGAGRTRTNHQSVMEYGRVRPAHPVEHHARTVPLFGHFH